MEKTLRLDANGVPVLSRIDLEEWAERFVSYFSPRAFKEPGPTPINEITQGLVRLGHIHFVINAELGSSPEGFKYRGRFHIPSRTIFMDRSLEPGGPRFNFTLAHELAHFVLHRDLASSAFKLSTGQIADTDQEVLNHLEGDSDRTWLEWQANAFASSMLLPRLTVGTAIRQKQWQMGITRNLGLIYNTKSNRADFNSVLTHLGDVYQVSRSAARLRLRELNLLIEEVEGRDDPLSVGEIMRSCVRNVKHGNSTLPPHSPPGVTRSLTPPSRKKS